MSIICFEKAYADFRRWLPMDHPLRQDNRWSSHQEQRPPPLRTRSGQEAIINKVLELEQAVKLGVKPAKDLNEYITQTGVFGACPLNRLSYFDPIRDSVTDMMHTGVDCVRYQ